MTVVLAASGICPPATPRPGWVAIDDGRIVEVADGDAPKGARDLEDVVLAPGYIDLQVNGVADDDFAVATPVEWDRAAGRLLAHGVTAYFPTFVSAAVDAYPAMLERATRAQADADSVGLPAVLGVHLEGPFLGGAPGAHRAELLRPVDVEWLDGLLRSHPGLVRIVTLSPEADPGFAGTRLLAEAGVVVALGHSRSSYDDALAATDAGARLVTHVFNGMGPLHHREPGLAGAALDDDRLLPTVIADLAHVHPALLRIVFARCPDVAIVSDSVAVAGDAREESGAARLPDGTLIGSTSLLDRAVANIVGLGIPIERAIESVTSIPAAAIGVTDRGRLVAGAHADLVALDPDTLLPRQVWRAGSDDPARV